MDRRLRGLAMATILAALQPTPARALICETLGRAGEFSVIAGNKLRSKDYPPIYGYQGYGCSGLGFVGEELCAPTVNLSVVELNEVVATASAGTAVAFHTTRRYPCLDNDVTYGVVTGGGAVRGVHQSSFDDDTTGTHPRVETCRGAITDAAQASASFAALPPTQVFGDVFVRVGEIFEIDATGGGIIQLDSLRLEGVRAGKTYGHHLGCAYRFDVEPAVLWIYTDPQDEVVVNVPQLSVGNCAEINVVASNVVFNVPGRGPSVRIGVTASVTYAHVLAPERSILVYGARDEAYSEVGSLWARNVQLHGFVFQDTPGVPCGS